MNKYKEALIEYLKDKIDINIINKDQLNIEFSDILSISEEEAIKLYLNNLIKETEEENEFIYDNEEYTIFSEEEIDDQLDDIKYEKEESLTSYLKFYDYNLIDYVAIDDYINDSTKHVNYDDLHPYLNYKKLIFIDHNYYYIYTN